MTCFMLAQYVTWPYDELGWEGRNKALFSNDLPLWLSFDFETAMT